MRARIAPLVFLTLLIACKDQDLAKVAKGLLVVADTVGSLQTTVIDGNSQGLISEDDTRRILEVCVRVNLTGKSATAVTKQIAKLDQPSREQLLEILKPVIRETAVLVTNGTAGIKNELTKQRVQLILLSLETALNTLQIVLASGG